MYMLWFNFILGSNFIFLCFKLIIIHYNTQKQKKRNFEPRIKLKQNMYNKLYSALKYWNEYLIKQSYIDHIGASLGIRNTYK